MSGKIAVIAIGGNSLITSKEKVSMEHQYQAVHETSIHIADMIEQGWTVLYVDDGFGAVALERSRESEAFEQQLARLFQAIDGGAEDVRDAVAIRVGRIDAVEGVTRQDGHVAGYAWEAGRGLVLSETGRVVFSYADEIFRLSNELRDVLSGRPAEHELLLRVGRLGSALSARRREAGLRLAEVVEAELDELNNHVLPLLFSEELGAVIHVLHTETDDVLKQLHDAGRDELERAVAIDPVQVAITVGLMLALPLVYRGVPVRRRRELAAEALLVGGEHQVIVLD